MAKIEPLTPERPAQYGRLCKRFDNLAFRVELRQRGRDNFTVIYGLQVDERLTYGEAAAKLGQAIMHALACESELDNRQRGEK